MFISRNASANKFVLLVYFLFSGHIFSCSFIDLITSCRLSLALIQTLNIIGLFTSFVYFHSSTKCWAKARVKRQIGFSIRSEINYVTTINNNDLYLKMIYESKKIDTPWSMTAYIYINTHIIAKGRLQN